jgi:oligopeptide transport system substrate-binding protein
MIKRTLGLVLIICGVVGCAPRESAVEAGNRTQTLHLGNSDDPSDLDPHTNVSAAVSRIGSAPNEGLVNIANDRATIKPGLATSWDISPDGLVYTFQLREDAKWSNGEPLVADDYVAEVKRFLTPLLAAESVNIAFSIVGA